MAEYLVWGNIVYILYKGYVSASDVDNAKKYMESGWGVCYVNVYDDNQIARIVPIEVAERARTLKEEIMR